MRGSAQMKALNGILAAAMLVLLAMHALGNAFQLFGMGSLVPAVLAWALALIAALHFALGIVLTAFTLVEQRRAGVAYWRLNKRFWAVRASGLAIAVFAVCHVLIFGRFDPEAPVRLAYFGPAQLAASLLLVASLLVHVLANLQPLMITLGIPQPRGRAADLGVALSVALLVCAVAFIAYFLRWSVM